MAVGPNGRPTATAVGIGDAPAEGTSAPSGGMTTTWIGPISTILCLPKSCASPLNPHRVDQTHTRSPFDLQMLVHSPSRTQVRQYNAFAANSSYAHLKEQYSSTVNVDLVVKTGAPVITSPAACTSLISPRPTKVDQPTARVRRVPGSPEVMVEVQNGANPGTLDKPTWACARSRRRRTNQDVRRTTLIRCGGCLLRTRSRRCHPCG